MTACSRRPKRPGCARYAAGRSAAASGRTIDDRSLGTGANHRPLPDAVGELVLAEPDPHMLRQLRPKAAAAGRRRRDRRGARRSAALRGRDFDTAGCTLVLCTVPDPAATLAEAARVLRPGGRPALRRARRRRGRSLARWQDRLETPWRFIGDGCHCNRDTIAAIEASPLRSRASSASELPKAPPIVRPLVRGSAVLSG